jgi:hypothetical protein
MSGLGQKQRPPENEGAEKRDFQLQIAVAL